MGMQRKSNRLPLSFLKEEEISIGMLRRMKLWAANSRFSPRHLGVVEVDAAKRMLWVCMQL